MMSQVLGNKIEQLMLWFLYTDQHQIFQQRYIPSVYLLWPLRQTDWERSCPRLIYTVYIHAGTVELNTVKAKRMKLHHTPLIYGLGLTLEACFFKFRAVYVVEWLSVKQHLVTNVSTSPFKPIFDCPQILTVVYRQYIILVLRLREHESLIYCAHNQRRCLNQQRDERIQNRHSTLPFLASEYFPIPIKMYKKLPDKMKLLELRKGRSHGRGFKSNPPTQPRSFLRKPLVLLLGSISVKV